MKKYLYVRNNVKKGYDKDIAIVKAKNIEEAYLILQRYYNDIDQRDIYDMFMQKGKEIKILSDY